MSNNTTSITSGPLTGPKLDRFIYIWFSEFILFFKNEHATHMDQHKTMTITKIQQLLSNAKTLDLNQYPRDVVLEIGTVLTRFRDYATDNFSDPVMMSEIPLLLKCLDEFDLFHLFVLKKVKPKCTPNVPLETSEPKHDTNSTSNSNMALPTQTVPQDNNPTATAKQDATLQQNNSKEATPKRKLSETDFAEKSSTLNSNKPSTILSSTPSKSEENRSKRVSTSTRSSNDMSESEEEEEEVPDSDDDDLQRTPTPKCARKKKILLSRLRDNKELCSTTTQEPHTNHPPQTALSDLYEESESDDDSSYFSTSSNDPEGSKPKTKKPCPKIRVPFDVVLKEFVNYASKPLVPFSQFDFGTQEVAYYNFRAYLESKSLQVKGWFNSYYKECPKLFYLLPNSKIRMRSAAIKQLLAEKPDIVNKLKQLPKDYPQDFTELKHKYDEFQKRENERKQKHH
ncbi:hypothetical protein C9374_013277 [Naegleria lovaniensis]|uniref:Uncharacterized protein n=1 Tax=Naegleria lovaniensis TaxID=51637 RepID=A0AA88KQ04_NAELO|nr:uncharacterized protein C9374_013277 [Naegleria lovaniensis]KAG2391792.1 hypothetical protein C9374_013277 [Naegleria lovaniensis]